VYRASRERKIERERGRGREREREIKRALLIFSLSLSIKERLLTRVQLNAYRQRYSYGSSTAVLW
jgi:hypothetical protein